MNHPSNFFLENSSLTQILTLIVMASKLYQIQVSSVDFHHIPKFISDASIPSW